MELKDQIRLAREAKKLSIEDVATVLVCSEQAVKYWEAGDNVPRPKRLRQLSELLGVHFSVTGQVGNHGPLPDFLAELSPEAIELARMFDAMPKVIRHAILLLVEPHSCYKPNSTKPAVVTTTRRAKKTIRPTLVTESPKATYEDGNSGKSDPPDGRNKH